MKTLLTVLLGLSLLAPVFAADSWHYETVDSVGAVGRYNSIALDSFGYPHISYVGESCLKYSRWDGSSWHLEEVDTGDVGSHGSLVLDSSDNPYISYANFDEGNLKFAYWDGSSWQVETVDSAGYGGSFTSLALDSSGKPHISYLNNTNEDLRYAHWSGTAWQIETVDSTGVVGAYTSLVLDSSDNPHISYYDRTNGALKYARWDGSSWQIEIVDTVGDTGLDTSMVLDASGNPHISYWAFGGYNDLKYAYWSGTAWQIETVDSTGDVGNFSSLALDSSGYPHISYHYRSDFDVKYAHWNGSTWMIETVDSSGILNWHTSLALDSYDNPRISYYDEDNANLEYAWYGDPAAVDDLSLSAKATDDGVLLSWSIIGDEPATVSVLRSVNENQPAVLSGELSGSATSWLDVSAQSGMEYAYYLQVTELDGTVSRFGPSEVVVPGAVSELTLSDPYPNPASSALTISYDLATDGAVSLSVYDLSGRLVETLVSGEQTAGRHSIKWDSSAEASGVYLLRLEAAGEAITKRAVISR